MRVNRWMAAATLVAVYGLVGIAAAEDPRASGQAAQGQLRSSKLIGATVLNRQNEELGTISEIVTGPSGRGNFVVFSSGGVLGIGGKMIVVPWAALRIREAREGEKATAVLDLAKQRLEQAPSFAKDQRPDFNNQEWISKIESFYKEKQDERQPAQPGAEQRHPSHQTTPQKPRTGAEERQPARPQGMKY